MKDFDDYKVADITEEDVQRITSLEKMMSEETNHDIVLIAYQSNSNKSIVK